MADTSERRRRLIVDSPLQGRIVLSISWPISACIAGTAALLVWFTGRLVQQASDTGVALPGVAPLLAIVLVFMGSSLVYLIWHFVKLSNRVVGPMRRIQRTLEDVRGGKSTARIRLREGDFLIETAGHINAFLDWMESQSGSMKTNADGPQGRTTEDDASVAPQPGTVTATEAAPH